MQTKHVERQAGEEIEIIERGRFQRQQITRMQREGSITVLAEKQTENRYTWKIRKMLPGTASQLYSVSTRRSVKRYIHIGKERNLGTSPLRALLDPKKGLPLGSQHQIYEASLFIIMCSLIAHYCSTVCTGEGWRVRVHTVEHPLHSPTRII